MVTSPTPPFTPAAAMPLAMRRDGYAVLAPSEAAALCGLDLRALDAFKGSWDELPPDRYLKDSGNYRHRRHSCFVVDGGRFEQVPARAHWQSEQYNALHGGMRRWFDPIRADLVAQPAWQQLLCALADRFSTLADAHRWFVEAHQFRIDTVEGIGRPTPEGAHRDGVDFVAVFLVDRVGITGGETRVFDATGPNGQRFTLVEPWSLLLLDDARVIHESTPIQPSVDGGHRDTLVLTYRGNGFQGD